MAKSMISSVNNTTFGSLVAIRFLKHATAILELSYYTFIILHFCWISYFLSDFLVNPSFRLSQPIISGLFYQKLNFATWIHL